MSTVYATRSTFFVAAACILGSWSTAAAQFPLSSAFTFQGRLVQSGTPVDGATDMMFILWNDPVLSGQENLVGSAMTFDGIGGNPPSVNVADGLFTVELNAGFEFGSTAFNGDARWLEIAVRHPAGGGGYTTLSPRQPVSAAPYALFALRAAPHNHFGQSWGGDTGTGLSVNNTSNAGLALEGIASAIDGATQGVRGQVTSFQGAAGVQGDAISAAGASTSIGVRGTSSGGLGVGVFGHTGHATGVNYAFRALTASPNGYAGYFEGGRNYFQGNVGIGVTAPQAKLHIGGTPGVDGVRFPDGTVQVTAAAGGGGNTLDQAYDQGGPGAGRTITADAGAVNIVGANGLTVNATVGVGTTAPERRLHVHGSQPSADLLLSNERAGVMTPPATSNAQLELRATSRFNVDPFTGIGSLRAQADHTSQSRRLILHAESANMPITLETQGLERLRVDAEGDLGIGAINPSSALHILKASIPPPGLPTSDNGLLLGIESTSGYKWVQSYGGHLALNPVGNFVGVGTTAPTQALHVAGNVQATGWIGSDAGPVELFAGGVRALRLEEAGPNDSNEIGMNVIGGSNGNTVAGGVVGATIAGGGLDDLDPGDPFLPNVVTDDFGTVAGGVNNQAGDGDVMSVAGTSATVGGGRDNTASGHDATVPGGLGCTAAGDQSFAAGSCATALANHHHAFVWADFPAGFIFCPPFLSVAAREFAARCTGGARFVTAVDGAGSPTAGVTLAAGASAWGVLSDRSAKENFSQVDHCQVLDRLAEIPIETWNYRSQGAAIRHIGPVAQDFYAAFGVGEDDRHISTIDADGVALAAVQGLHEIVRENEAKLAEKDARISALEARLAAIEARLAASSAAEAGDK